MIRLVCSECGADVLIASSMAGLRTNCPDCATPIPVPRLARAARGRRKPWQVARLVLVCVMIFFLVSGLAAACLQGLFLWLGDPGSVP